MLSVLLLGSELHGVYPSPGVLSGCVGQPRHCSGTRSRSWRVTKKLLRTRGCIYCTHTYKPVYGCRTPVLMQYIVLCYCSSTFVVVLLIIGCDPTHIPMSAYLLGTISYALTCFLPFFMRVKIFCGIFFHTKIFVEGRNLIMRVVWKFGVYVHETEDVIHHKADLPSFLMNLFSTNNYLTYFSRILWGMSKPILECQCSLRCKLEVGGA
jgi:hypothetical protein